ncbi:MAG TPA: 6-bladed beta-propeller, partial [Methanoregulaceae archaeon]|nr:6-bladed beta-propeller [Methanoregulaceae archaeon]
TDPDLDGYYEDLNGNGRLEFDDIMVYFFSMEWMMENPPFNHFDYNANGRVEFDDLYALFMEI